MDTKLGRPAFACTGGRLWLVTAVRESNACSVVGGTKDVVAVVLLDTQLAEPTASTSTDSVAFDCQEVSGLVLELHVLAWT